MRNLLPPAIFLLLIACFFTACHTSGAGPETQEMTDSTGVETTGSPAVGATDDPAQLKNLEPAEKVVRYFEALNRKDFKSAQLIRQGDPSGFESLSEKYKDLRQATVTITGETGTEAAAGTAYATVPVSVVLEMNNGKKKTLSGAYLLSKPNSSGEESYGWKIYSEELTDSGDEAGDSGTAEQVQQIRQEFKAINNAKLKVEKHQTDCGEVSFYTSGADLRKIKRSWFAGDYGGDEEFYFKNGELIFVYYWDEGGAANEKVTRQECRYYFHQGELVRNLSDGTRTCLEISNIQSMAADAKTAFAQKKYSLLNCFDQ